MSFSAIRSAQEQARRRPPTPKWKAGEGAGSDFTHETLED
jgi:hypothetical protein